MPETMLLVQMALFLLVVGAFAGVLAGLLGVGGGIVLVPAFFYVFSVLGFDSPQLMQICLATSLATIIATSARSLLAHHRKSAVDWAILKSWAPGIAIGKAYVRFGDDIEVREYAIAKTRISAELKRLADAVDEARQQIRDLQKRARDMRGSAGEELVFLFDAYLGMLDDSRLVRGAR